MELVWHNCKTYPPKEDFNDNLITTNGDYVLDMSWIKEEGYFVSEYAADEWIGHRIEDSVLENWWWADIQQTVWNEPRFET